MLQNRTWFAFANEKLCDHRGALKDLGFVSWTTNVKSKFMKGDIVFLFMNDDRAVRFKLKVAEVNVPREDGAYWKNSAPRDMTYRLKLVDEYTGNLLNEDVLKSVGFRGGNSILTPMCNDKELMEYINDVFNVSAKSVKLPSYYVVVDLESGAYWKKDVGHEVFNLEPNSVDGHFYGYMPPHDNPSIVRLGASKQDDYIDGVMVVYVKKMPNSSNRQIIAFTDNARVYAKKQSGKGLNRFIIDKWKRTECTYTIESEYIYDLRAEPNPFVFEVSGDDLYMFREQRFYTGRRPKQEVRMLMWLTEYLQRRSIEENDDFVFQKQIQDEDSSTPLLDTSKSQICYSYGTSGKTIARKAKVSKYALKEADFKCMYDETHETFSTERGTPYMEGHHLIPCTASNSEYFWNKCERNIDCVENVVCLCPTCHRRIHFGSKEEKEDVVKSLYDKRISLLRKAGFDITIEELLSLYS